MCPFDHPVLRFDIDDRKGLEVVLLAALLTFTDHTEGFRDPANQTDPTTAKLTGITPANNTINGGGSGSSSRFGLGSPVTTPPAVANVPPLATPTPPRIELTSGSPNEIFVTEEGTVRQYAEHCAAVLAVR